MGVKGCGGASCRRYKLRRGGGEGRTEGPSLDSQDTFFIFLPKLSDTPELN